MPSSSSSTSSRLVTMLAVALTVTALYFAEDVLLPIAVAALISFVLAPLADQLERYRLPRVASTALVVALAFVVFGLISWGVTDQAVQVGTNLPQYKQNLVNKIRAFRPQPNGAVARVAKTVEELGAEIRMAPKGPPQRDDSAPQSAEPAPPVSEDRQSTVSAVPVRVVELPPDSSLEQVWLVAGPIFAPLATLAVIVVLVSFILLRREDLRNRMIEVIGRSDLRASTAAISDAAERVSRYLRMTLLINAIYGGAVAVGLAIIGLPNPLLWGVLAMTLRFLPYVGPWIGAAMPIALSLVVFDGWLQPLFVAGLFILLEPIINLILEPLLYSSGTGMSPIGVILAAMFWTWLWGPIGLIVAVPLTVCLVVVANHVPQLRFISVLLGDRPTMSPAELIYQRLLAGDDEEAAELARKGAASTLLPVYCDAVLLPTLAMAERDRIDGGLDEERYRSVIDGLRDLTEESSAASLPADAAGELADAPIRSRARVLCVSACGPPCELAAEMLTHSLQRLGIDARVGSTELLASELVDRVREEQFDAVVISALPPHAIRSARYLLKKIRQGHADLPVVVGLWQGEQLSKAKERFDADGATTVAASIREAARAVRQIAVRYPAEEDHESPPDVPTQKAQTVGA